MSSRAHSNPVPNKETSKGHSGDAKTPAGLAHHAQTKTSGAAAKGATKSSEMVAPPAAGAPPPTPDASPGAELLGSLTTQQQQRTSARVIKKLLLDDAIALDKKENQESDTAQKPKEDEKDASKLNTVKPRMPKAIWLTDEKNLFFEALNEYGKDFDAITTYICAKMKKKGVPDIMLKTKNQVSHFYYRTWHKLSKHVHFDENVKRVAQELYALINYGELRKRLPSVKESTCARLGEMVSRGSLAVRARGRGLRVRTPACRALRMLNQITERAAGFRVCGRCVVTLRARDAAAWARVQSAAHNPRSAAELPLRAPLVTLVRALEARWRGKRNKAAKLNGNLTRKLEDTDEKVDLESHLDLKTDRVIVREQRLPRKLALHVGPSPKTSLHIPQLSASEHITSHKLCFASYLERMGRNAPTKIRTPKRQRKDSATEKEKEPSEPKKLKIELDTEPKPLDIDETAIDGIELMAIIKHNHEEEDKPCTEDEKEKSGVEEEIDPLKEDKDKDMSEKEKDSFSEMEDDEKYNNDTDNESDHKVENGGKERKFKNLKVKFRIRPKKRGGSIYTLITGSPAKEPTETQPSASEDAPKLPEDHPKIPEDPPKAAEDLTKIAEEPEKPDIDVEFVTRQIRKGWSVVDAGQLTIGDLYLMFGSRSKIELDYWWAEPTPPLSPPLSKQNKRDDKTPTEKHDKERSAAEKKSDKIEKERSIEKKGEKTPEKTDSLVDEDKERSDTDIFSPKTAFGQDSNDGMSGDERKSEQLSSPEHKFGTLPLASKLINRPEPNDSSAEQHLAMISDRLKRLLALAGNPHVIAATGLSASIAKCNCSQKRNANTKQLVPPPVTPVATEDAPVFRHPTPIAPKSDAEMLPPLSVTALPRWHSRGRARAAGPVVVQRLLPLLPKLNQHHQNLIPVKLVSNTPPPPPRLAPKPAPALPELHSELSHVYILSESNGQFFFHDGDRRIPIVASPVHAHNQVPDVDEKEEFVVMDSPMNPKSEVTSSGDGAGNGNGYEALPPEVALVGAKSEATSDIGNFLPAESWSMSPSRLLASAECAGESGEGAWLGGSAGDFSLSSFLGHLEARDQKYQVDSQLQSLMAESSVDYVAKFADLAAEVTDDTVPLAPAELP